MTQPKRIAITGAAGQICYSMLFRIAAGDIYGPDQPVSLHLLEITPALGLLEAVKMELDDCAFPLLADVVVTDDPKVALNGVDAALFVGAKPRGPGMERSDLITDNGKIFSSLGAILNEVGSPDCKVVVVGNPANTNAFILKANAPNINPRNITALPVWITIEQSPNSLAKPALWYLISSAWLSGEITAPHRYLIFPTPPLADQPLTAWLTATGL